MIQQKITEIAKILGWSVDFSEPQNGKTDVNFAKYTSYGQDFNFSVELEDDDMEAFIDNIHEYYENFDVDVVLALYQRCSFRQTGQCEGLNSVERATDWLRAFCIYTLIIIWQVRSLCH